MSKLIVISHGPTTEYDKWMDQVKNPEKIKWTSARTEDLKTISEFPSVSFSTWSESRSESFVMVISTSFNTDIRN